MSERTLVVSSGIVSVYQNEKKHILVDHPGSVGILAFMNNPYENEGNDFTQNTIALIEQIRPAVGKPMWEVPAGMLDVAGEDPQATALRELTEETGYKAKYVCRLGMYYASPGYTSEKLYLYAAHTLTKVQEPEEGISLKWVKITPFVPDLADFGAYGDAKTELCLAMWFMNSKRLMARFKEVP